MNTSQLRERFKEVFGVEADHTFFSPGRINLIGEHTDYNGGNVLPVAITLGTYGAARKRDDKVLRFFSANFEEKGIIEVPLENLRFEKEHNWTNYPKGVLHFLHIVTAATVKKDVDWLTANEGYERPAVIPKRG